MLCLNCLRFLTSLGYGARPSGCLRWSGIALGATPATQAPLSMPDSPVNHHTQKANNVLTNCPADHQSKNTRKESVKIHPQPSKN